MLNLVVVLPCQDYALLLVRPEPNIANFAVRIRSMTDSTTGIVHCIQAWKQRNA